MNEGREVSQTAGEDPYRELEETLGYRFTRRELLVTALTAPSYRAERSAEVQEANPRREVRGDAVRGLLAAQHAYDADPQGDEGRLTVFRSRLASGRALAELGRRIGLGGFLRLGRADEAAGGRDKDRSLTDALEALFGAAWCDGGLPAVQAMFRTLLEAAPSGEPADLWEENPKGQLQEVAQRHAWPDSPQYESVSVSGPSHAPHYTFRARVAGGLEAVGEGRTKRAAEAAAARALLERLRSERRV
jgi:ribonuclease-3